MKRILLMILGLSASVAYAQSEFRTFKQAKGDKTLVAKIAEKKPDNSKVRLVLKKGGTMWVKPDLFSEEDQKYIEQWENADLGVKAKTVATAGTTRGTWGLSWGRFDANGAEVVGGNVGRGYRSRIIGVEFENKGSIEDFVMEVFWLGYRKGKKSRKITAMAAAPINLPTGERFNVRVGSTYNLISGKLNYTNVDSSEFDWDGFYVNIWSGYNYAGWVVRISDGNGLLIKEIGSQPAVLRHIENVPVPKVEGGLGD